MKKTLFYACLTLILGSLSFSGCANKKGSTDRAEGPMEETFEKGGAMEKGSRSADQTGENY